MWAFMAIAAAVLAGVLFCIIYVSMRTARFPFIVRISGGRRFIAILIAMVFYLAVSLILYSTINTVNAIICMVHLGGFWLLSELVFFILRKAAHIKVKQYIPGIAAIVFTVCYMGIAWYLCNHAWETDYKLESEQLKGNLRIVQITDSHVGATFHAQGLHDYVLRINELNPDIVAVTGDFVDDDTSREDMIGSCEALGDLKTKYGVYFCFGNHDKGYYSADVRGWDVNDLVENLEKNNVTVLEDESVLVDGRFYVVGRKDKSEESRGSGRKTPGELMADLDPNLYKVVLDHQPCNYDDEAQAGAGLVLSGHSHGGQFFPFNQIGVITREYERSYGYERRGNTDFIVSSGISDWTLIFKTGCKSEYVVADVTGR